MTGERDEVLLSFSGVGLGYGRRPVVEGVSFEVQRGDFLAVVGPNGAGKTTILRALLGLLKPSTGGIERKSSAILGYVPQRERIDTILPVTAFEVAMMGCAPRLGPLERVHAHDRARVQAALSLLGVEPLAPRLFRDLSGGQQQRVLLARALAADPDLLVLDEPTNGMDLASEHAIVDLLLRLNRERRLTVILVTHLLNIAINSARTILLLQGGRSLFGPVDEVLHEDRLRELYGLPIKLGVVGGRRTLVVGGGGSDRV